MLALSLDDFHQLCNKSRETPIWLKYQRKSIQQKNAWVFPFRARERLIELEIAQPPRLIVHDDSLLVPLYMPLGEEKSEVVNSIVEQVKAVLKLLHNKSA